MFIFMLFCTIFVVLGLSLMAYLTYKLADEVINFKLLFLYLFKYNLTEKEAYFVWKFKSYMSFLSHYEYMIDQCEFFNIDKPTNVREGLEIVMELSSYD